MIQKIKDVLDGPEISNFMGSEKTRSLVEQAIISRWGESELKNYDPYRSALTFKKWLSLGFVPKKNEKAIRSFIVIENKDPKDPKKVVKKIKSIYLFYYRQVVELKNNK